MVTEMRALLLVLALGGCAAPGAVGDDRESRALERQLADRAAGEPQDCITHFGGTSLHAVDRQTLVYDGPGTLYVNRLESRCPSLRPNSTIVVETYGDRYCRNDRIRALEAGSSIPGPICRLGRFTPYRRQR